MNLCLSYIKRMEQDPDITYSRFNKRFAISLGLAWQFSGFAETGCVLVELYYGIVFGPTHFDPVSHATLL